MRMISLADRLTPPAVGGLSANMDSAIPVTYPGRVVQPYRVIQGARPSLGLSLACVLVWRVSYITITL